MSSSSFNADTFSLGLSFLHLVTGHAPYEELLEHVRCPPALQQALERIWVTSDTTSPYFVISEVLRSLEVMSDTNNSADADETVMAVLYDTLYRYIVLLGLPNADLFTIGDVSAFRNPVVCAVLDVLDQGMNENADADVQIATMKYIGDSKIWNISTGNHSILKVARNKLAQVSPEAELWLRRMLCYDPLHRYNRQAYLYTRFECDTIFSTDVSCWS